MTSHHLIHHGDARQMSDIPDGSAHLIVTSPPYWQLIDYGVDAAAGQVGFHNIHEDQ
jgi:DNA modification methylase